MHMLSMVRTLPTCLTLGLLCVFGARGSEFAFLSERLSFTDAEETCKQLNFDGLAIINTPEEYRHVLEASKELRLSWGIWLGLRFDSDLETLLWDDGTPPASDMPWLSSSPAADLSAPCARIHKSGPLGMLACRSTRYAICGNRIMIFKEATGSTRSGERPASVTSSLAEAAAESYLQCATLCSMDYLCRAAHFDAASKMCNVLGPGSFSGFEMDTDSVTFVRSAYEQ